MEVKNVTVKLVKSPAGRLKKQKACVAGLGLRRIGDEVVVEDTTEEVTENTKQEYREINQQKTQKTGNKKAGSKEIQTSKYPVVIC